MIKKTIIYAFAACFLLRTFAFAVVPDPLIYLNFDGELENKGIAGYEEGLGKDIDPNDGRVPTYSSGIKGYALDLTQNVMGQLGNYGRFCDNNVPDVTPIETALNSGLKSFTITGWMYIDTSYPDGSSVTLFKRALDSGDFDNQIRLFSHDEYGRFRLAVNNIESSNVPSEMAYWGIQNRWIFFAVSYDGTLSSNNVQFYVGYDDYDGHVWHLAASSIDAGTVQPSNRWLFLGAHTLYGNNSWSGKLDELRFFGSSVDNSGVLSLADLQAVHTQDLQSPGDNLPEPLVYISFDNTWTSSGTTGTDVADIHVGRTQKYWYDLWQGEGPLGVIAEPNIFPDGVRCQCLDLYHPDEAMPWDYHGRVMFGRQGMADTPVEEALAGLQSFTITGWFNTVDPENYFTAGETFVFQGSNPYAGTGSTKLRLRSYGFASGAMSLIINDTTIATSDNYAVGFWGEWTFFAVTYDSNAVDPQEVIRFYGANNNAVRNVKQAGLDADGLQVSIFPQPENNHYPLLIGNQAVDGRRNVKAMFDEIRIYGSKNDSSGALNYEQIKAVRARVFEEVTCPSILPCYDPENPDMPYIPGDVNYDCIVDMGDFSLLALNWLLDNNM